jgi:hypothetical protein
LASCRRHIAGRTAAVAAALMSAACSSINPFSDDAPESTANQPVTQPSVTSAENAAAAGSPANPFMWQAALEHVGFMPLQKVDDLQGEIVTDWYVPPGAPLERFRLDVVFSSRALRAESLAIDVQRQELRESGNWYDAPASPSVSSNLLDSILARALVLRQESGTL